MHVHTVQCIAVCAWRWAHTTASAVCHIEEFNFYPQKTYRNEGMSDCVWHKKNLFLFRIFQIEHRLFVFLLLMALHILQWFVRIWPKSAPTWNAFMSGCFFPPFPSSSPPTKIRSRKHQSCKFDPLAPPYLAVHKSQCKGQTEVHCSDSSIKSTVLFIGDCLILKTTRVNNIHRKTFTVTYVSNHSVQKNMFEA